MSRQFSAGFSEVLIKARSIFIGAINWESNTAVAWVTCRRAAQAGRAVTPAGSHWTNCCPFPARWSDPRCLPGLLASSAHLHILCAMLGWSSPLCAWGSRPHVLELGHSPGSTQETQLHHRLFWVHLLLEKSVFSWKRSIVFPRK